MTRHQMPGNDRDRKSQSTQGDRPVQGRPHGDRSDAQRMGSNDNQQRQSPGRGDEGKGRDSGGDRR